MATSSAALRDESRCLEDSCDSWIKIDAGVVVTREFFISLLAALKNPLLKWLTNDGINHITDIAPWHLANLPSNWECIDDFFVG